MKTVRKSLAFVLALIMLVGTFAISASATEETTYSHPAGRFLLTPAATQQDAIEKARIAPGETVYSSLEVKEAAEGEEAEEVQGCYMFNSGSSNFLRFQFKASVECTVEIVESGSSTVNAYSGNTKYDFNLDLTPNKYYFVTVKPTATCDYTFTTITNAITSSADGKILEPIMAISHKEATLYATESLQVSITNDTPDIINFYWDVLDNESTPLVNEKDIVKVFGVGQTATITVERNSTAFVNTGSVSATVRAYFYYNGMEYWKTCVITAKPANLDLNPYFDSTAQNCVLLGIGGEQKITGTTSVKGAKVVWTSKDPSIAEVVPFGTYVRIIGKKDGSTEVYADVCIKDADGNYTDRLGRRTIRVDVSSDYSIVTGVEFSSSSVSLRAGKTAELGYKVLSSPANVTPENTKVTFTSSNTAVATVDAKGVVTAVAPGEATITVKTDDGGFTAQCKVTVQEPLPNWLTLLITPLQFIYTLIMSLFK